MAVFISDTYHKKHNKDNKTKKETYANFNTSLSLIGTCLTRPHSIIDRFGFQTGIFVFKDVSGDHYLIHFPGYLNKLLREHHSTRRKVKVILAKSSLSEFYGRHLWATSFVLL